MFWRGMVENVETKITFMTLVEVQGASFSNHFTGNKPGSQPKYASVASWDRSIASMFIDATYPVP